MSFSQMPLAQLELPKFGQAPRPPQVQEPGKMQWLLKRVGSMPWRLGVRMRLSPRVRSPRSPAG